MTQIENLLRAATRDAAAEVTPESIPRFDEARLPVPRPRLPLARPLTPLLAAAAVVLVVVLSLVLSSVLAVPRPAPAGPVPPIVPQYYVALTTVSQPTGVGLSSAAELTVRSTTTGTVVARVTPPRPYGQFLLVDGTADNRTFLVAAQVWHTPWAGAAVQTAEPVRLFLLHFDPSTDRATLSALRLPQFNGLNLLTASISPNGRQIAIAYQDGLRTWLHVYTLPSYAERTWTPTLAQEGPSNIGLGRNNPASVAWAANDRTISFVWGGHGSDGVHVFDTRTPPGDNLLSASRFVIATSSYAGGVPANSSEFVCASDPFISGNGAYILCGGYVDPARKAHPGYYPNLPTGPVTQGVGEFSVRTGKLITVLGAVRAPVVTTVTVPGGLQASEEIAPLLLWASPDASILIGVSGSHAFVVRNGHRLPIPWPASVAMAISSPVPGAAW